MDMEPDDPSSAVSMASKWLGMKRDEEREWARIGEAWGLVMEHCEGLDVPSIMRVAQLLEDASGGVVSVRLTRVSATELRIERIE